MMADSENTVMKAVGLCANTLGSLWRKFAGTRLSGFSGLPRTGAPHSISNEKVHLVVEKTLSSIPEGTTYWSTRKIAKERGLYNDFVVRIWKTFGLKPHRSESFQISTDPYYVEEVRDVTDFA